MRRVALVGIAVGLLAGAGRAGAADRVVEEEMARLRGTWRLVSAVTDGVKAPEERTAKVRVIIKGSRHTVTFGDQEVVHEVPFTIDPTTTPRSVTDVLEDGPDKGKVIRSIYKLDGDTLTSCAARVGGERPTRFASEPGSGHTLRVFRKVKDMGDARSKAVEEEWARFEGTWRYESTIVEGQQLPDAVFKDARLILKGDRFEMTQPMGALRGTYEVDPTVTPKLIEVTFTEGPNAGKSSKGIYELDRDTYKVCVGMAGRDRPKSFESKPGSGHVLQVLRREKP